MKVHRNTRPARSSTKARPPAARTATRRTSPSCPTLTAAAASRARSVALARRTKAAGGDVGCFITWYTADGLLPKRMFSFCIAATNCSLLKFSGTVATPTMSFCSTKAATLSNLTFNALIS